jgi:hypothetical protein
MQWMAASMSPELWSPALFGKTPSPRYATHCITLSNECVWFVCLDYQSYVQDQAAGRSVQRHNGGGRRPGDRRGAERLSSLIHPAC